MENQPAHNAEAEAAILGSLLLNPSAFVDVRPELTAKDFYLETHQHIYNAICALADGGKEIDTLTVLDQLEAQAAPVEDWQIVELATAPDNAFHIVGYVEIVKRESTRRKLTRFALKLASQMRGTDDPFQLLAQASEYLHKVNTKALGQNITTMPESVEALLEEIHERVEDRQEGVPYRNIVPTGFIDLDRQLDGGFERGALYYFGGVEKMGKTAFLLSLLRNIAMRGKPVLFFSLEMTHKALNRRNLASMARIPLSKLKTGNLSDSDMSCVYTKSAELQALPVTIDDAGSITPAKIRQRVNQMIAQGKKPEVVLIDYLQLIGSDDPKDQEKETIEKASESLRQMAKHFDIPFVVTAQLVTKSIEQRQDKRPRMADFFGSSKPTKDGMVLAFLYRPSVYEPELEDPNVLEVIIKGNRDGAPGTVYLHFDADTNSYNNLHREHINLGGVS